jgi:hypothetical protein
MKTLHHPFAIILTATVALTPSTRAEQLARVPPSSRCSLALSGLRYPPAALAGRIMGEVSATVEFDPQGAITSIQTQAHPLLASEVARALRATVPAEPCASQRIEMHFKFILDQDLDPKTPPSVRTVATFSYEIIAPAEVVVVTISDPAWVFSRKGRFFHRVKRVLSNLKCW